MNNSQIPEPLMERIKRTDSQVQVMLGKYADDIPMVEILCKEAFTAGQQEERERNINLVLAAHPDIGWRELEYLLSQLHQ